MIRLEIKKYNMILTKKHYYQIKLINMNVFQMKKYYLLIKVKLSNKAQIKKKKIRLTFKNTKKKLLNDFESKIFQIGKQVQGKGHSLDLATQIRLFTPTQMLQMFYLALA